MHCGLIYIKLNYYVYVFTYTLLYNKALVLWFSYILFVTIRDEPRSSRFPSC